ncbi:hypothetical protein P153DRAFT_292206 [Dothidotthia symphoricarpi CBS 119687]|uniref:Aflatoxin regulatory protein domain-containing protein n=1 Tax=Dothidotthia symphoricarpi CBS 119687 TaxID=1392245 RepID=A0A6A6ADE6_9PLEO|nr:uncharacterized protein P153DRAFT_292206 [Dothidotthia symphoricarpi CBS 119687]KAF2129145.1 hypothetical protein P153DRAFT_292206 [Dothidotthia symphoricarpi CBS 119687]
MPCVSGYTRPRGRSPRRDYLQGDAAPPSDFEAHSIRTFELPESLDSQTLVAETTTGPLVEEISAPSWSLEDFNQFLPGLSCEDGQPDVHDDALDGLLDSYHFEALGPPLQMDYLADGVEATRRGSGEFSINAGHQTQNNEYIQSIFQKADGNLRLSQLNFNLCQQLARQKHGSTSFPDPEYILPAYETPSEPATPDTFGDMLHSMEEYIGTLQSLDGQGIPLRAPYNHAVSTSGSKHGNPNAANLMCMLNLGSCYFRIVDLVNILFLQLLDRLCNGPTRPSPAGSSIQMAIGLPQLQLAGFAIQQVGLQIKILIQTVQHQFERIEKLLGLSAELCVSGREDAHTGCVVDERWSAVFLELGCALGPDSDLSGKRFEGIRLLRASIARTQQLCTADNFC